MDNLANLITIRFEDKGQDFLEWDLDGSGFVRDSRPYPQAWVGTLVMRETIKIGEKPQVVVTPGGKHPSIGWLKYSVVDIKATGVST